MKKVVIIIFLIVISLGLYAQESKKDWLKSGFVDPPREAKPLVWWDWINGNVTKEGILADLTDMKRVGIGGAQLFDLELYMPEGPVRYGSESWYEHVKYAIHIADSLGLEFHVMNCPGWSASGGPWNTPETSAKQIVWSDTILSGGTMLKLELLLPEIKLNYFEEIAVFAVPSKFTDRTLDWEKKIAFSKTSLNREFEPINNDTTAIPKQQVLNLTEHFSDDGILQCSLPEGEWTILRFGYTTTGRENHPAQPEGHGLECDKMDAASVHNQFQNALGRIIDDAKTHLGKTFKGILFDSFEGGYSNWTKNFPAEFERMHKYDLLSYLPVLTGRVIESKAFTEAILSDFRYTVEKLHADIYLKTAQEFAHKNGLITYSETQGGPMNPFYGNKYIDVPMNEFWLRNYTKRASRMKFSASSANLYNKRMVAAESFTAIPEYAKWQNTPYTLKKASDAGFSSGINRLIFHTFVHQPYDYLKPGFTMGRYGTHFGRQSTWWPYAGDWIDYLTRSSFLLQKGKRVTDIGMLLGNDKGYMHCGSLSAYVPKGYDYMLCSPEFLANARVVNGKIKFSDIAECSVLVLDKSTEFISVEALQHLYRLVKNGAVIAGKAPLQPAGLLDLSDSLEQFNNLVDEIWGGLEVNKTKTLGKGKVLNSTNKKWIVKQLNLKPDLEFVPNVSKDSLRYVHKKIADKDLYFVANLTSHKQVLTIKVRIQDKKPELWDPVSETIRDASAYNIVDEKTEIPITLEPAESVFIVFNEELPSRWTTNIQPDILKSIGGNYLVQGKERIELSYSDGSSVKLKTKKCASPIDLSDNWQVEFSDGRDTPKDPVLFNKLISWTKHANESIKYYSGSAEYSKSFKLPKTYLKKGQRCILSLGDVNGNVAQVRINESKPMAVWYYPAEIDITDYLVKGENSIKVMVANTWVNRLIGDEHIEVDIPYREGSGKFTTGVIEEFPDWMRNEERAKKENPRHTFATWKHYSAESPLIESGLLGPIKLIVYNELINQLH